MSKTYKYFMITLLFILLNYIFNLLSSKPESDIIYVMTLIISILFAILYWIIKIYNKGEDK